MPELKSINPTAEQATASALRLINSHFDNDNKAVTRIPVQPTDDDVVVMDYIEQSAARIAELEALTTPRPIETAPKNGKFLLVFTTHWDLPRWVQTYWDDKEFLFPGGDRIEPALFWLPMPPNLEVQP